MGRHRLIIDGYNVMHAHPEYGALARHDMDSARARLVSDLTALASAEDRVTVVFDGGGNPHSDGVPHHIGGLTVLFSPAGMTADTVIEALAQRARERAEDTMVITSDGATRDAVRSGSVSIRSAESFIDDLRQARDASTASVHPGRRITLSERIDPSVSDVLARWARGERP
ncbi:MAG: NYN domain-containing protein [Coriobacteriia bacterium]|nr:NYN domain-containing protein [Coriobacteriia bacterium]MBN2839938.1 NYN domain-containing protein [Coriobacteriia bacterium]